MGVNEVDPRWRAAVDASRAWYDDVFAVHGRRVLADDDLWWSPDEPLPWHSCVRTLRPGVAVERVVRSLGGRAACGVADSYGDLDLAPHGRELLFEATWVHLAAPPAPAPSLPDGWSVVTTPRQLAAWSSAHDYTGVLVDEVLAHPGFHVLARHHGDRLAGGAVVHQGAGAAGVWNVWAAEGAVDWPAVVAAASHLRPGHDLVGYERGPALAGAVDAGFVPVGPQRVWV